MSKYQVQLDSICRRQYVKPTKPISGIEKMQAEQEEAREFWSELEGKDGSSRV